MLITSIYLKRVQVGSRILLADGLLSLRVTKIDGQEIHTEVVNGGELSSRKRVACPGIELNLPFLSEQDKSDIIFLCRAWYGLYSLPPLYRMLIMLLQSVRFWRNVVSRWGLSPRLKIFAGVEHIEEIINVSDGIMVARGDLGVEIPTEDVPLVQKDIIARCNKSR